MPIAFESLLSSAAANATFLDKTIDDTTTKKITLDNPDSATIDDPQNYINNLADTVGQANETDANRKVYSSNNYLVDGENHKQGLEALDAQVKTNEDDIASLDSTVSNLDADDIDESATRYWSLLNNLSATVDPTATDDSTLNYAVGSLWFNQTTDTLFINEDATATAAVWTEISGSGGGGGGSFVWEMNGNISPLESTSNGISYFDFNSSDAQEVYALVTVPSSYSDGDQILLKDAKLTCASSSGNVLLKTETTLIKPGGAMASTDTHTSSNSELTLSAANVLSSVGDMSLTDSSGEINSVAVTAGDVLVIKLFRDFANETSSATSLVKFLKYSASISFIGA